jgi:dihydroneopterin aldolase
VDKVTVSGLSFHAYHGCHPDERKTGGEFVVDLEVYGNFSDASKSDQIESAVDYVALMNLVSDEMKVARNLIEALAHDIALRVLDQHPRVIKVCVEVKKLRPPVSFALDYVSAFTSIDRTQN